MPIQIDVWSDFVCPYCFAVSLSLKDLQTTDPANIRWHAYELRPEGSPPVPPAYRARIEQSRPVLDQMFREQFGVEIKHGPFGNVSRGAHVAHAWARAQDEAAGERFHEQVFRAAWTDGADVSSLDVLRDCATAAGLDAKAMLAMLADPAQCAPFDDEASADIEQAYAMNLSGVPALLIEQRYLVPGAVPADTLRRIVAQIQSGEVTIR